MTNERLPRVNRGEIWLLDWSPGRGSEQIGRRPALVIQSDAANRAAYSNTIVAAISTKGGGFSFHVAVKKSGTNGLKADSIVKCEQLTTVSKDRLIGKPFGRLSDDEMRKVDAGLKAILHLA